SRFPARTHPGSGRGRSTQGRAVGDQVLAAAGVLRRGDGRRNGVAPRCEEGRPEGLTGEGWRPPNCGSERSRGRGPEGATEGTWRKRNPHIGRRLDEFIGEQRAKDPEFRAEFDRLQLARKVKGLRETKKMSQVSSPRSRVRSNRTSRGSRAARWSRGWTFSRRSRARLVDTWTSASLSGSRTRDGTPAVLGRMQGTLLPRLCPGPVKSSGLVSSSV